MQSANINSNITEKNELAILSTPIEKRSIQEWQIKKGLILEHRMFKLLEGEKSIFADESDSSAFANEPLDEKRYLSIVAALTRIIAGTQRGIAQLHRMDIDDAKTSADVSQARAPLEETAQKIEEHLGHIPRRGQPAK